MSKGFEPRIIAFLCNWCSYAGADLAGTSRIQYPPNIRVVRVMCSGRVEPEFVLEAFLTGMAGVLIGACHIGDCHYAVGNIQAEPKIKWLKRCLSDIGIEPERLRLEFVSASEGERFARIVTDFTNELRTLGELRLAQETVESLKTLRAEFCDFKVRWLLGIEREMIDKGNVYGEVVPGEKWERIMKDTLMSQNIQQRILRYVREEPRTVTEIAELLDIEPNIILNHLVDLKRRNLVSMCHERDIMRFAAIV